MKIKLLSIIGILVFVIILTQLKIAEVIETISKTNIMLLFIAMLLSIINAFIKALKWKIIVETQNTKFSIKDSFNGFLAGFSLSLASPGRIGDFARAYYVKNINTIKAFTTVLIDRILDILFVFFFAIIGLFYLAKFFKNSNLLFLVIVFAVIIITTCFLALNKKNTARLLKIPFNFFIPTKHKKKFKNAFNYFYESLTKIFLKKQKLAYIIILGFFSWIITFLFAFSTASSLGINIEFFFISAIIPIIFMIEILPISIAGLGTREASVIFLFSLAEIPKEQSIAFSLLFLFLGYLVLGLFGALIWIKEPAKFN